MKKLILLFLFIAIAVISYPQEKSVVVDKVTGKNMLVGKVNIQDFQDTAFAGWWNEEYNNYEPDSVAADSLKNRLKGIQISVIMGTWCGDSRREVPRFFRILEALEYPAETVDIICVDREKQGLQNETEGLEIEAVPTFIFYQYEKEVGRIIESPEETLEKDMLDILGS